jgi:hypothetical protein
VLQALLARASAYHAMKQLKNNSNVLLIVLDACCFVGSALGYSSAHKQAALQSSAALQHCDVTVSTLTAV